MDETVETRTSGGWFGHFGANVTKKTVSTSAAAGTGFREVVGIAVNVEDYVTGAITDCGVGACCSIIKQPQGVGIGIVP